MIELCCEKLSAWCIWLCFLIMSHMRTSKYSHHSLIISPVWVNGWVFLYDQSGCGFECHFSYILAKLSDLNYFYVINSACLSAPSNTLNFPSCAKHPSHFSFFFFFILTCGYLYLFLLSRISGPSLPPRLQMSHFSVIFSSTF